MQNASPTMPGPVVDRLVSIHAKLLQCVEAMAEFQSQIEYGGNEYMMDWHEILTKYSLLTSYTHSVFDLLITPPSLFRTVEQHKASLGVEKPAYKTREEQRILAQQESETWKRALSQTLVHPGKPIPQDKDFIIGVLLRTKQIPEVEAQEAGLMKGLPSIEDPVALYKQLKKHDDLADKALAICKRLKDGADEREFNWKVRVGHDEDVDEDEANHPSKPVIQPRFSTQDLSRFMRDGYIGR